MMGRPVADPRTGRPGSGVSDADWTSLVAGVGEEGAVDALLICGWYHAISYVARATRLAPEPGAPLFAGAGAAI
jgi:hypothetical protein